MLSSLSKKCWASAARELSSSIPFLPTIKAGAQASSRWEADYPTEANHSSLLSLPRRICDSGQGSTSLYQFPLILQGKTQCPLVLSSSADWCPGSLSNSSLALNARLGDQEDMAAHWAQAPVLSSLQALQ